jgi:hypothetical protein
MIPLLQRGPGSSSAYLTEIDELFDEDVSWTKGVACQEGQKCNGFWVRVCQDGRMPILALYYFAIDSDRRNGLQWAISSQTGKEQLLTTLFNHKGHEETRRRKTFTAD